MVALKVEVANTKNVYHVNFNVSPPRFKTWDDKQILGIIRVCFHRELRPNFASVAAPHLFAVFTLKERSSLINSSQYATRHKGCVLSLFLGVGDVWSLGPVDWTWTLRLVQLV